MLSSFIGIGQHLGNAAWALAGSAVAQSVGCQGAAGIRSLDPPGAIQTRLMRSGSGTEVRRLL